MTDLVLTLLGPDRPGLVELVASVIAAHGGNWLESRMSHLAGKFAGILRITADEAKAAELSRALTALDAKGLRIVVEASAAAPEQQCRTIGLELVGHDRPGIVREISRVLAACGVNIEEFESELTSAPDSGDILFRGRARLRTPPHISPEMLRTALEAVAMDLMVDLTLDEPAQS